jgi:hypothetical protein
MRAITQYLFTIPRYKCNYASLRYYINIRSLIFQKISKCALVLFQLSSAFMLAWLATYDAPTSTSLLELLLSGKRVV